MEPKERFLAVGVYYEKRNSSRLADGNSDLCLAYRLRKSGSRGSENGGSTGNGSGEQGGQAEQPEFFRFAHRGSLLFLSVPIVRSV